MKKENSLHITKHLFMPHTTKATNTNSSSTDNQTDTSTGTPTTGDSTDVMALVLLMTVAGATTVAAGIKKKSN